MARRLQLGILVPSEPVAELFQIHIWHGLYIQLQRYIV